MVGREVTEPVAIVVRRLDHVVAAEHALAAAHDEAEESGTIDQKGGRAALGCESSNA